MSHATAPDTLEEKQRLATARKYRRAGYRVTMPRAGDPLPSFLDGFVPDLVAERDGDHVIVEVKRVDRVPGSNDIVALAEKIAPQKDWRFELIAVPTKVTTALLDASQISKNIDDIVALGLTGPAYIFAYTLIENLLAFAALRNGMNPANSFAPKLARQLTNLGIISGETHDLIEQAAKMRNEIVHAPDQDMPSKEGVTALMELADRLENEILEQEPA